MKRLWFISLLSVTLFGCQANSSHTDDTPSPTDVLEDALPDQVDTDRQHAQVKEATKDNPLIIESETLTQDGLTLAIDAVDLQPSDNRLSVAYTLTNETHSPVRVGERVIGNLSTGVLLTENLAEAVLAPGATRQYTSFGQVGEATHMDWFLVGGSESAEIASLMVMLPTS